VSTLFARAVRGEATPAPPVWLMRQAGRYQQSYRTLRERHSFDDLCRQPELAAQVTLAPIAEFDFDAAILFSDLLFPLEALGFSLSYDDGPPKLGQTLTPDFCRALKSAHDAAPALEFQREAMAETRARLSADKALLGFVGGPWTLFVYALEGTHAGPLARAKSSLDLYRSFADRLVPLLEREIAMQFEGGADLVMIFDTAGGDVPPSIFTRAIAPDLARLAAAFPGRIGYYAKHSHPSHFAGGWTRDFAGVGFDGRWQIADVLANGRPAPFVQGNMDPALLFLTGNALDRAIDEFLAPIAALPAASRSGWICGLGHGVLPGTPEASVRRFVSKVRKAFS
jgi:uroporphyrinogen decarboxylase